ncbi:MAG: hydrogenase iron-sulfur subunit [Chloroflexota bacterium]|nr:hydrogenase iron-sulfur subunit [Chloroflexota bacterium]
MKSQAPKVLVLATTMCSYPGADAVGQSHIDYPSNIYVLPVPSPSLFPEDFYLRCFRKGIGGIIVMSCGTDCPYEGAYENLARRIDSTYVKMKEEGIDIRRLKLTAICSVCTNAFLREVNGMNDLLMSLGIPDHPVDT